jgi:hypothetical protein
VFFFFPFAGAQAASANEGASRLALPLLPAPNSAFANAGNPSLGFDLWGFSADLVRKSFSALSSSMTALGSRANALFTQVAGALAFDRIARDTAAFLEGAFGFGAQGSRPNVFGFPWASQAQGSPASFSSPMQGFMNPSAFNPWAAFAEGLDFWTKLWTPAAPQREPYNPGSARQPAPSAYTATKIATPSGFSWAFSLDA